MLKISGAPWYHTLHLRWSVHEPWQTPHQKLLTAIALQDILRTRLQRLQSHLAKSGRGSLLRRYGNLWGPMFAWPFTAMTEISWAPGHSLGHVFEVQSATSPWPSRRELHEQDWAPATCWQRAVRLSSLPLQKQNGRISVSAHGHRIVHVVFMFAIFAIFATSLKVWWKGRQIQQRDEVEAAQAGADVLWKSSKTTSYRRRKTGMNNSNSCTLHSRGKAREIESN